MGLFDKALGFEYGQNQANKKIRNAERENQRINNYYHTALNEKDQEIKQLKKKINEFLVSQEKNKRTYNKLKQDYLHYREESVKLTVTEYGKLQKAYELERKKTMLLEEKIKVLEATIEHLNS